MKHRLSFILLFLSFLIAIPIEASDSLTIKAITSGEFSAKTMPGIQPLGTTGYYTCLSEDGNQILQYAFKNGRQTAVLFDLAHTEGAHIESFSDYLFSPDASRILIATNRHKVYRRSYTAEFYIYTVKTRELRPLSAAGAQQSPVWSPDGKKIAFVRDNNIFLADAQGKADEVQVTFDGRKNEIINGLADWVNEEEFSVTRALTFNADASALCWIRYDESQVRQYTLQLFRGSHPTMKQNSVYPGAYTYKYPKAGEQNARVSAWSYNLSTGITHELAVPVDSDGYMPRLLATDKPQEVIWCTMNRHQDLLRIYSVNPLSGDVNLLITEQGDKYIKEEAVEQLAVGKDYILLPSDHSGFMNLSLYDRQGHLKRTVGNGTYDITDFYGIDAKTGDVFFQAAILNPHDRQVCVAHANGAIHRLTNQPGWNTALFSGDMRYFINTWSDYNTPYAFTTRDRDGKVIIIGEQNAALRLKLKQYGWQKRDTFSFVTADGVKLDGWIVRPANFDPTRRYPVILYQYSGPGSQQVTDSWNAGSMGQGGAYDQYFAQQDFIVACVDGRGTGGRGAAFEKCVYLKLGQAEAHDQVEVARYLATLPYVDKDNIGIWGWSYGGFNTLMSMSEGQGVFKAGVAVAPPTDWRYYDTIYTERYMRTPQENASGYDDNPIRRADKLHGALLICHGVADDNVHPQNTFEYAEALVQADKDFHENYYTNRNHSIYGGNTRNHLLRQVAQWFIDHLK